MGVWLAPPEFAAGQVASAEAHLNGLARTTQVLHDVWTGYSAPCRGNLPQANWYGWLRHRWNVLYYLIRCWGGGTANVYYAGTWLASVSGDGTYSRYLAVPGGLTVGQFYPLAVTGSSFDVIFLGEVGTDVAYSLAPFTDGTTPTAAQWQTLSNVANELHDRQYLPIPGFPVTPMAVNALDCTAQVRHHCRYLHYEIKVQQPYNDEAGARWSQTKLYVNGVHLLTCRVDKFGAPPPAAQPPVIDWWQNPSGSGTHEFSGELDLDTLLPGLPYGQWYTVQVYGETSTFWDGEKKWQTRLLWEVPAAAPSISGWQPLSTFGHGDPVRGDSAGARVKPLRDNLLLLQGLTTQYLPAARDEMVTETRSRGHWRKYRWLWYTNVEGATPKLLYDAESAEEVSLPNAYVNGVQTWQAFDLDTAHGLYPGMRYWLGGVQCSIEDCDA